MIPIRANIFGPLLRHQDQRLHCCLPFRRAVHGLRQRSDVLAASRNVISLRSSTLIGSSKGRLPASVDRSTSQNTLGSHFDPPFFPFDSEAGRFSWKIAVRITVLKSTAPKVACRADRTKRVIVGFQMAPSFLPAGLTTYSDLAA
jgi:hypothetical protein